MGDRDLTEGLIAVTRERMEELGLSLTKLSTTLGMNVPTLSRQLRGNGVLTVDEWERIAHALGARDLEELLGWARRRM